MVVPGTLFTWDSLPDFVHGLAATGCLLQNQTWISSSWCGLSVPGTVLQCLTVAAFKDPDRPHGHVPGSDDRLPGVSPQEQ